MPERVTQTSLAADRWICQRRTVSSSGRLHTDVLAVSGVSGLHSLRGVG